jgi:hypothetical protein
MKFGEIARECCGIALRGKWEAGRIVVCGRCFLPYTAFVARQVDPVTSEVAEVPSWWTGLLPAEVPL